ncbi:MAG: hypothetical protein ISS57_03865 [Anaerolineales bacterium]|nr:hypothetical protein [Anaerolineales bacterium]
MPRRFSGPLLALVIVVGGLLVCALVAGLVWFSSRSGEPPTVAILQPEEGSLTLTSGQGLVLLAEGQAAGGVQRIEFLVDRELTQQHVPESLREEDVRATFPWFSSGIGVHELSVVAYDSRGRASEPVARLIGVQAAISQIPPGEAPVGEGGPEESPVTGTGSEDLSGEAPPEGDAGQLPGGEQPPPEGQPPAEALPDEPGGGQPQDEGGEIPQDEGVPPEAIVGRPPIFDPSGEVLDVEPPTVHLEIDRIPGEAAVLITAEAEDNVGLALIRLAIESEIAGQEPVFHEEACAGQPQCIIAPSPFEQRLSPGEWWFILEATDTSGNTAPRDFDLINIICEPDEPCAMAEHDDPDPLDNLPPGVIIFDSGMVIAEVAISPPAAPSDLTGLSNCNPSGCPIILSWADNSDNETGFKILRDGLEFYTTRANAHQYGDRTVEPGEQHAYRVKAFNEFGESAVSNGVVVMGGDRAVVASYLTASPWCGLPQVCDVTLSWTDNSDNETGFRILRNDEEIAIVGSDETDYWDRNVVRGERYAYKVQVFNNSGPSAASNEVVVVAENVPAAPSDLTASSFCGAQWGGCLIELHWVDNSNDEDGFVILRDGQEIGTHIADRTRYDDRAAELGQQYSYTVKAYNQSGESLPSNAMGLGVGSTIFSISGRVYSECPSEKELFGTYQWCLTPIGPCFDRAGPACSPGISWGQAYYAEGATIELARCHGQFRHIPDGEFFFAGGPGHPCSGDLTPLAETHTDGDGRFSFEGLGPGIYQVRPIGFGEAGRFADHTDYALTYSKRIKYVGIRYQSPYVRFKSITTSYWPCGYSIEPYRLQTDDLVVGCVSWSSREFP